MSAPQSPIAPPRTLALLHAALAGDPQAERQLIRRLLLPILDAAVSKYLFGNAKRHYDKEDIIHEVFMHLYEQGWARLRTYDPKKGTLVNYVRTVAKNWIIDHSRKLPPPEPVDDTDKNLAPDSSPESKAQTRQTMERVLEALDEEDLLLFRWVHLEGVEARDIADRLEISIDATYKRIQRLDAKVKAVLSNADDMPPMLKGRKS
jgi:RNA polymerase sigma factor (sigma-70 family)